MWCLFKGIVKGFSRIDVEVFGPIDDLHPFFCILHVARRGTGRVEIERRSRLGSANQQSKKPGKTRLDLVRNRFL